ncbi:hypothetical protein ACGC1H_005338 [Rhizoctonia solani]
MTRDSTTQTNAQPVFTSQPSSITALFTLTHSIVSQPHERRHSKYPLSFATSHTLFRAYYLSRVYRLASPRRDGQHPDGFGVSRRDRLDDQTGYRDIAKTRRGVRALADKCVGLESSGWVGTGGKQSGVSFTNGSAHTLSHAGYGSTRPSPCVSRQGYAREDIHRALAQRTTPSQAQPVDNLASRTQTRTTTCVSHTRALSRHTLPLISTRPECMRKIRCL